METLHTLRADVAYLKELTQAGFAGVTSEWHDNTGVGIASSFKKSAWMPMTAAATAGLLAARYGSDRKKASRTAITGTALGVAAALAWASREFARAATRSAVRRINASRDAHWLALNPIDYA